MIYCLALYWLWFSMIFTGYGWSYNVGTLGSSIFWNVFYFALMGLISSCLQVWYLPKINRRPMMMAVKMQGLIFSAIIIWLSFYDDEWITWRIIIQGIGRLTGGIVFHLVYLMSSEIFPTSLRQISIGSCSVVGRFGSIAAPFVKELVSFVIC